MAKITFFPVGNGDTSLTEVDDGRMLLIDYCDQRNPDDKDDKRIDLSAALRSILERAERTGLDITAFTHADGDHVARADQFFHFKHDEELQGGDRVPMGELWVPAAFVLEAGLNGAAKLIQKEARYRLKEGKDIRVFSSPGRLDDWLRGEGIDPAERANLITHAGDTVPGFSKEKGAIEIFVHSPFSYRFDEDEEDRNNGSLVLHFTFFVGGESRWMMGGDAEHPAWRDLVLKTEQKKRTERLDWDGFKISHHCSYTALAPEKGQSKTEPIPEVKRLFEDHGQDGCVIVSSSKPIDSEGTPPHTQAAAYYRDVVEKDNFLVTMEHPNKEKPAPIEIEIGDDGHKVLRTAGIWVGPTAIASKPSQRYG